MSGRAHAAFEKGRGSLDPGIEAIASPYTMAAMAYVGDQVGMSTEARYVVPSHDVHWYSFIRCVRAILASAPPREAIRSITRRSD